MQSSTDSLTFLFEKLCSVLVFKAACVLTRTGQVQTGVHVFEVILEDFPTTNITLTHADGTTDALSSASLCRVKLQFSVEGEEPKQSKKSSFILKVVQKQQKWKEKSIGRRWERVLACLLFVWLPVLPPVLNCQAGHVQPTFLFPTPSHSRVLYATVGHSFELTAAAQAGHAKYVWLKTNKQKQNSCWVHKVTYFFVLPLSWRIQSFQVSGPSSMNKTFTEGTDGRAQMTLSWVPRESDAHRSAPVCFTAETNHTWEASRGPWWGFLRSSRPSEVGLFFFFCHSGSRKWGASLSWWPSPRTVKVS